MKDSTLLDTPGTTVHDVLEQLEKSGSGAVCLTDESGRLTGIITDGDVRRALLKGETGLDGFINRNPVTMNYPAAPDVISSDAARGRGQCSMIL